MLCIHVAVQPARLCRLPARSLPPTCIQLPTCLCNLLPSPPPTISGDLVFVFNFHPTNSYTDYRVGCYKGGAYKVSSCGKICTGWPGEPHARGCGSAACPACEQRCCAPL